MASHTRSSLVTFIGLLTGDKSNQQYTEAEKQAMVQRGQEAFVMDSRVLVDVAKDSIVADTSEYSLPTDILDMNRAAVNGLELNRKSKWYLDFLTSQDWSNDKGTPGFYYIDIDPNNKKIRLYPTPQGGDAGTNNLVMDYVKIPPALTTDASVPFDSHTLLAPYHEAIAYWAAARFLEARRTAVDFAAAREMDQQYKSYVEDAITAFRAMEEEHPQRIPGGRNHSGL